MSFRYTVLAVVLFTGSSLLFTPSAFSQKLAIHATQAEVDIWKQRRVSGPYLDDWNRILTNANAFLSSPSGTWVGNQLNSAWLGLHVTQDLQPPNYYPGGSSSNLKGTRTHGVKVRDAGFVYLVTGDTRYSNAVRSMLLTQAGLSGTDFSNKTKWPTNYVSLAGNGWTYEDIWIGLWLRELLYAYSYTRDTFNTGEKAAMDNWFLSAATWFATVQHDEIDGQFPNRLSGSWTQSGNQGSPIYGLTHLGGYQVYTFHYPWQNKRLVFMAFVAGVGALLNNTTLIHHAKTHVKEFLMFEVYPDGTIAEQARWNSDGNPQTGWGYAVTCLATVMTTIDHIARTGDTELYTWTTSDGRFGSAGGPKSILRVLRRYADMALGKVFAYASTNSTSDAWKRIDPEGESPNPTIRKYIYDVAAFSQANMFFKDSLLASAYQRTLPSNPSDGGYNPWGGDWGTYPGVLFMFGQMEQKVSLYAPGTAPALNSPSNLAVIVP